MFAPKRIMAPIDFSEFSLGALETAKEMAKQYGAAVLLVNVVPLIPTLPDGVPYFQEGAYEQQIIGAAKESLADLAGKLTAARIEAHTKVGIANDAAMEIVRVSEEENVDLIVMATHGRTGWRRLALGSVTDKVARTAACPDSPEPRYEPCVTGEVSGVTGGAPTETSYIHSGNVQVVVGPSKPSFGKMASSR